jgi:ABC-type glycerol-3-phosphate transport system permease component
MEKTINLTTKKSFKSRFTPLAVVLCVFLALYALSIFALLIWALLNGLKNPDVADTQIVAHKFYLLPSFSEMYNHLPAVFKYFLVRTPTGRTIDIWTMLFNGVYYAVTNALASSLIPCITAYCCARYPFKFSKFLHSAVLVVMIIPIVGSTPSSLDMSMRLGIYNNLYFYWIMHAHFVTFYFLIFYNAFKTFPPSFVEAAKIDGANNMQIMLKISFPLIKNLLTTVWLLFFISYWNDYSIPYLYLPEFPTIANGFFQIMDGTAQGELNNFPAQIMAALVVVSPVLVLFCIFQKKIMGGLTVGGIKG